MLAFRVEKLSSLHRLPQTNDKYKEDQEKCSRYTLQFLEKTI
uniref:Uncharacterized protein n=1 Tax=Rhizophora mucronata TaxID=61149 RepID=A0A2P2QXM8_RHIMU